MNADRRMRLWALVVEQAHGKPVALSHIATAAELAVGVDGVAVTLVLDGALRETVYASNANASALEELTLTFGEGPCVDAFTGGGPVLVDDATGPQWLTRWPAFAQALVQAGGAAVFALPLQVGAIRLGVLDLYRSTPGELTPGQLADGLVLADTACALLLDGQDEPAARRNGYQPEQARPHHPEVHQATGMISVQLGVTATVALIRLRAYAYANDRALREVAGDVVARRLRFHPDGA
jgi:hypothetical protein